jgi:hypothetical protein
MGKIIKLKFKTFSFTVGDNKKKFNLEYLFTIDNTVYILKKLRWGRGESRERQFLKKTRQKNHDNSGKLYVVQ